ncbi:MAG: hypothetical protein ACREIB_09910 [Pseudomonadota bacterium]
MKRPPRGPHDTGLRRAMYVRGHRREVKRVARERRLAQLELPLEAGSGANGTETASEDPPGARIEARHESGYGVVR